MKILIVAAARPNFVKIAPVIAALQRQRENHSSLEFLLVHTGQHYDSKMSGSFFADLAIPEPDINLEVGSGSHAQQTGRVMMKFEQTCIQQCPDWVIVVGDVNSTMACAITAKKLGIRIAHIEAGLRSRDLSMPEEINRLCTDVVSDLLFTTEPSANANLYAEGIPAEKICFAGNTMIDTLLRHVEVAKARPLAPGLSARGYAVLTLHRPSNVDNVRSLRALIDALADVATRLQIVFPAHPRTAKGLESVQLHPNIRLLEPLGYIDFLGLIANARLVLTDSGGIQEETTALGVPCITLRDNTERPVTCEAGTNVLAGTNPDRIRRIAAAILDNPPKRGPLPQLWDGHAAERIVTRILDEDSPARG